MNKSSKPPKTSQPASLNETLPDYNFELPVEPGYRELPPKGTWEDGYRLSLAALELIKDRPWIWEEREKRRCYVEFKM